MKKRTVRSRDKSRRSFVKTAAWVAPAVLTLKVTPAFAQDGSARVRRYRWHPRVLVASVVVAARAALRVAAARVALRVAAPVGAAAAVGARLGGQHRESPALPIPVNLRLIGEFLGWGVRAVQREPPSLVHFEGGVMGLREISLRACGCAFQVSCSDDETAALVNASFGGLAEEADPSASAHSPLRDRAIAGPRLPSLSG